MNKLWMDGAPPAYADDKRHWVVIEYRSPVSDTIRYLAVLWNGSNWCDKRVGLAIRWMPIPTEEAE